MTQLGLETALRAAACPAEQLGTAMAEFEWASADYAQAPTPLHARAVEISMRRMDRRATAALGPNSTLSNDVRDELADDYRRLLRPYVYMTEVTRRMLEKPRGYAGDFVTIELIYRNEARGIGPLGQLLDRCFLDFDPPRAVRYRRALLCEELARSAAECPRAPLRVTSLACGPAREIFDFAGSHGPQSLDATLVDIDPEALEFVEEDAEDCGLRPHLRRLNLIRAAVRRDPHPATDQNLVYSIGVIDYLSDALVIALLDWIHGMLRPGGRVILGNFHPCNPSRAMMDEVLEWKLVHRTESDLDRLLAGSRFGKTSTAMRTEATGVNLFASCTRD